MNVELGDLRVRYLREGSGPPMVLIHGGGVDLQTWDPLIPLLADQFTLFRIDLRGYGESVSTPARAVTANDWIDDLKAFLDRLQIKRPGLIGWALGGCIAARFAVRYPADARFIVMLGSPGPTTEVEVSGIQARSALISSGVSPDEVVERTFAFSKTAISPSVLAAHPEIGDALKAALKRNMRTDYPQLMQLFRDAITSAKEYEQVRCPALVMVGEHDVRTPPAMSDDICKYIDRAYMKVIRNCGHFYAYEQPEVCAQYIREFEKFVSAVLERRDSL